MQQSLLKPFPAALISVNSVWIDMLPRDGTAAAMRATRLVRDPRARHFHDPRRRAGEAIGRELLFPGAGPAWDIYLFYAAGSVWTDVPPAPLDWVHQLSGSRRADPARFRTGDALVRGLRACIGRLIGRD